MADIAIIRANEQRKAFAGQLYNLAAALFAAVVVKLWTEQRPTWESAVWLIGAIGLISVGHGLLGLIEDES